MVRFRSAAIASGLIALAGCTQSAPPAADTKADEAAIRAAGPAWFNAYNAGDANAVAALYADDAVLNAPGAPPARGMAAIREGLVKDIAATSGGGFTLNPGTSRHRGLR